MTPPPGDRTSLRWRITAMLSPEVVALILTVAVLVIVAIAVFLTLVPGSPAR